MIKNVKITKNPIKVIEGDINNNIAIIFISITNISQADRTFDVYIVQNGKSMPIYDANQSLISGNEETIFIKNQIIKSNNTFIFNTEKILLGDKDALYVKCNEDDVSLVCTISYEVY